MSATATAASPTTALTIVERVETSPAVMMLDARGQGLVDLLPDAAAATRFRRVVIQALVKNPELLDCTPDSVVLSVFEAAAMGLEPTGAAGGAHLVPYKVNVGSRENPRYERHAQLIPDYRGVIRLVTKEPTEVLSLEARVVKEGDEFTYQLGTEAFVHHIPSLAAGRSAKATTHVYAIARLKNGASIPDVEDRAGIERIQKRGRGGSFSPWATDWDEMAKKTIIKRIGKVLPVRPEIRSILVREDEEGEPPEPAAESPRGTSKAAQLAARLKPVAAVVEDDEVAQDDASASWIDGDVVDAPEEAPAAAETTTAGTATFDELRELIRERGARGVHVKAALDSVLADKAPTLEELPEAELTVDEWRAIGYALEEVLSSRS